MLCLNLNGAIAYGYVCFIINNMYDDLLKFQLEDSTCILGR